MNYPFLIVVAVAGVALGMYMARRRANDSSTAKSLDCIQDEQTAKKLENKHR